MAASAGVRADVPHGGDVRPILIGEVAEGVERLLLQITGAVHRAVLEGSTIGGLRTATNGEGGERQQNQQGSREVHGGCYALVPTVPVPTSSSLNFS